MVKKDKGKSNHAKGTKQIWVEDALHTELKAIAKKRGQTIKVVVERMLNAQLKAPQPSEQELEQEAA